MYDVAEIDYERGRASPKPRSGRRSSKSRSRSRSRSRARVSLNFANQDYAIHDLLICGTGSHVQAVHRFLGERVWDTKLVDVGGHRVMSIAVSVDPNPSVSGFGERDRVLVGVHGHVVCLRLVDGVELW